MILIGGITFAACYFIPNNWYFVICKFAICAVVPILIFSIIFSKNQYYKYCIELVKGLLKKFSHKNPKKNKQQEVVKQSNEIEENKKEDE